MRFVHADGEPARPLRQVALPSTASVSETLRNTTGPIDRPMPESNAAFSARDVMLVKVTSVMVPSFPGKPSAVVLLMLLIQMGSALPHQFVPVGYTLERWR